MKRGISTTFGNKIVTVDEKGGNHSLFSEPTFVLAIGSKDTAQHAVTDRMGAIIFTEV